MQHATLPAVPRSTPMGARGKRPDTPGVETMARRADPETGDPQVLVRYGNRLYLMQAGSFLEDAGENASALREISRIYLRSPEEAKGVGRALEELGAGIYPLSLAEAVALTDSGTLHWIPAYAAAPLEGVVRSYEDEGTPVGMHLLLVLLLALFLPAILLSPANPAGVELDAASRLPTVGVFILSLLLVSVLLVSRSVGNAVAWWRIHRRCSRSREALVPLVWWSGQSAVLLAAFAGLAYVFVGLI